MGNGADPQGRQAHVQALPLPVGLGTAQGPLPPLTSPPPGPVPSFFLSLSRRKTNTHTVSSVRPESEKKGTYVGSQEHRSPHGRGLVCCQQLRALPMPPARGREGDTHGQREETAKKNQRSFFFPAPPRFFSILVCRAPDFWRHRCPAPALTTAVTATPNQHHRPPSPR